MPSKKVAIIKRGRGSLPGGYNESIQARAEPSDAIASGGEDSLVSLLAAWSEAADELSGWWTPLRDRELRALWHKDGMLASTIYTMQAILSTIGYTIEGKADAVEASHIPFENAEFGKGMKELIKKIAEDWFTQDNGFFIELIGPGAPDTPLLSAPEGIAHLDAGRCWRTMDSEYPVYYSSRNKGWIKMHWTRVAFASPNPSAIESARGIGFCVVSRVAMLSRMMRDTVRYKMEKISGRQTRAIMAISGAPMKAVKIAVEEAERAADNRNQIKYSAIPIIASPSGGQKIETSLLELAKVPDGFKWEDEVQLFMYILALAFGIDARELWPSTQSGATKADAEVQHRKAMRKGVGDFVSTFEHIANTRICVGGAVFGFKPKDNEEDEAEARVEKARSETAAILVDKGIVTQRGALLWLVNHDIIPREYLDNPALSAVDLPGTGISDTEAPAQASGNGPVETPTGNDGSGQEKVGSAVTPTTKDESGKPGAMAKKGLVSQVLDGFIKRLYNEKSTV